MNSSPFSGFGRIATTLVALCIVISSTQAASNPNADLADVVNHFLEAGNYSWEAKDLPQPSKARVGRPFMVASGQTDIGGFSMVQKHRAQLVMWGNETAFLLRGQWRHVDDLSPDERRELAIPSRSGAKATSAVPLPHEILPVLCRAAANFRKEGSAIVFDLDVRRIASAEPLRGLSLRSGERVIVRVELAAGKITGFSVEALRPTTILNGPDAGDRDVPQRISFFEIMDVGRTRVDVAPEAKALFLSAPKTQ